jgi:hypothetical protein
MPDRGAVDKLSIAGLAIVRGNERPRVADSLVAGATAFGRLINQREGRDG